MGIRAGYLWRGGNGRLSKVLAAKGLPGRTWRRRGERCVKLAARGEAADFHPSHSAIRRWPDRLAAEPASAPDPLGLQLNSLGDLLTSAIARIRFSSSAEAYTICRSWSHIHCLMLTDEYSPSAESSHHINRILDRPQGNRI